MAQSPQLKQSSPTSPDPQDFRLDATPAMRADNVVSGEHWRIGLITDSLVRFEWSDSGVFENRPTQTVLNRDFGSPVERIPRSQRIHVRHRTAGRAHHGTDG